MQTFAHLLFVVATTFICLPASEQNVKPRVSPARSVTGMIEKANITIAYSSPSVKGRKIWGGLVPYDSVWRAGANEATTFETDQAIMVAGKPLPPGKYSFFLLPHKSGPWTAIFNRIPNQWGAFHYDSTKDQLRVSVVARRSAISKEALVYTVEPKGFSVNWEKLAVLIPVN